MKTRNILIGTLATFIITLGFAAWATAQVGSISLLKLVGGTAMQPIRDTYTLGSNTNRIAHIYADYFTASTTTVDGVIASNMLPSLDDTWDIGSATKRWVDAYFSGTVTSTNAVFTDVVINGTCTGAGCGTADFTDVDSDLIPDTNNAYDIGAVTSSFANIYASGTAYMSKASAGAGAVGTPSITFTGDPDTGLYSVGANSLGVAIGGAVKLGLTGTALTQYTDILPSADNTYDLGSSAYTLAESHVQDAYVYDVLQTGRTVFTEADKATFLEAINLPCGTSLGAGLQCSYVFNVDSQYMLKLYSEGDGSGGIQNESIDMYPNQERFGKGSATTTWFIGTMDGCGMLQFTSSSTFPTLTPTSTSACL